MDPLANIIQRQWKGEEPLWKAFWVYGMMVGTFLDTILLLGMGSTLEEEFTNEEDFELIFLAVDFYAVSLSFVFFLTYAVWNFVSVWRCARNTEKPVWRWSARGFYIFCLLYPVIGGIWVAIGSLS